MWLRRRVKEASEQPSPSIFKRLEVLEDDVDRLERRFESIKGEFTQSIRKQRQLERDNAALQDELDKIDEEEPDYDGE